MLQAALNPAMQGKNEFTYGGRLFREGDRVMQIRNNYQREWELLGKANVVMEKGSGVFNGDTGTIREVNRFLKLVEVGFDDGRRVYYAFQELEELELIPFRTAIQRGIMKRITERLAQKPDEDYISLKQVMIDASREVVADHIRLFESNRRVQ